MTETRDCLNCRTAFSIAPDDASFYEKIGVGAPTLCPDCRYQRRGRNLDLVTDYISVGYGGFRSNQTYWSEPCAVDQRIVQVNGTGEQIEFLVSRPMWSGMSGGPVISERTASVVGYIVNGAGSLEGSTEVMNFTFRPISNIPLEYREIEHAQATEAMFI